MVVYFCEFEAIVVTRWLLLNANYISKGIWIQFLGIIGIYWVGQGAKLFFVHQFSFIHWSVIQAHHIATLSG